MIHILDYDSQISDNTTISVYLGYNAWYAVTTQDTEIRCYVSCLEGYNWKSITGFDISNNVRYKKMEVLHKFTLVETIKNEYVNILNILLNDIM